MGFYGNITNTSRTSFQFDRVYPSRLDMDAAAVLGDGVYVGRYVLVNYEENGNNDYYINAYKNIITIDDGEGNLESKIIFGASKNGETIIRFKFSETPSTDQDVVYRGQTIIIPADHLHNMFDINATKAEYWHVTGFETINNVDYALFEQYADDYAVNYNKDFDAYHSSRGYDSTVWQKVYTNGQDKYVMVAELNTIVPTFDLEADAPKMVPLTPHFDADSTNVYYKLHWSPSWGFRVKSANSKLSGPILTDNGYDSYSGLTRMRMDNIDYPSDERTLWHKTAYDGVQETKDYLFSVNSEGTQGRWIPKDEAERNQINGKPETVIETPAAIYYNKKGFDPTESCYSYFKTIITEDDYINRPKHYYKKINGKYVIADDITFDPNEQYYEKVEDHILIEPTGRSGHMYNKHDGSITDSVQEDTQELSIMLPTIGDTIAAVWDLIYGDESINGLDPQGRAKRNLDISWESARADMNRHGLRLITDYNFEGQYNYQTKNVDTVAGAINSVHDLMGMIITSASARDLENNIDSLDINRIYYNKDTHTFNRKRLFYDYTPIEESSYTYVIQPVDEATYKAGEYYIKQGNDYIIDNSSTFTEDTEYYLRTFDTAAEYAEEVNLTIFDGSKYAYKDFIGSDNAGANLTKMDFIRDPKFYRNKTYYNWSDIQKVHYPNLADTYEKNIFYKKDTSGNYLLAQEENPSTDVQYYTFIPENVLEISSLPEGYSGVYIPGKFLYKDGENYRIDTSFEATPRRIYYKLDTKTQVNIQDKIYNRKVHFDEIQFITYDQNGIINEDRSDRYVKNTYWIWKGTPSPQRFDVEEDYILATEPFDRQQHYYIKNETLELIVNQYYQVDPNDSGMLLMQYHDNEFYYKDEIGNYIAITQLSDVSELTEDIVVLRNTSTRLPGESNSGTYILNYPQDHQPDHDNVSAMIFQNQFYEPGKFHYLTSGTQEDENFTDLILDTYPTKTHGSNYYQITGVTGNPVTLEFFDPYEYYEQDELTGEYNLITEEISNEEDLPEHVYKRNLYYVIDDTAHIYQKGALWNFDTPYIPATLTLGTRSEHYGLEPFTDFARNINTMHGMLLKIKSMLDYENKDTRDLRTVQGALNTLSDKIAQFSTWTPGEILIVDDYGRLHSADPLSNKWINTNVNSQIKNPSIEIVHNFTAIPDTNNTTNLNTNNTAEFSIDTPLVDETGHVGGFHTETYQLPHGYGIINGDDGTIAAGGSYATMKLEGSDDWINTQAITESNVKKVKITHEFTAGTDTASTVDLSTSTLASFPDISVITDAKGHVVAVNTQTIQFPHGYGLIAADNGNALAANNTYATLTIGGADNWISTTAETGQKISVSHSNPVTVGATAIGPITAQTPGFGATFNIPAFSIDAKGHVATTGIQTVTIPDITLTSETNQTTNQVLTSLNYNAGIFTQTTINPAELVLTGYSNTNINPDNFTSITASDNIASALNMLEQRIVYNKNSIDAANTAIDDLSDDVDDLIINFSGQEVTYQPQLSPEVVAFWDSYEEWAENHTANEDGYVVVEVTEENFAQNTYYIINNLYDPEAAEPVDKYIYATTYNSNDTYYQSFTYLQTAWLANNDPNNIYTSAGRPGTPEPQTATLEQILKRLTELEAVVANL